MKVIVKPAGQGKTQDLIRISESTGYTIVCKDFFEFNHVVMVADRLVFKIPRPILHKDFVDGVNLPPDIRGVLIDDADWLLSGLARGLNVKACTFQCRADVKEDDKSSERMLALESLTPGGSEFVGDVKACVRHVKEDRKRRMDAFVKMKRAKDAEIAELKGLVDSLRVSLRVKTRHDSDQKKSNKRRFEG